MTTLDSLPFTTCPPISFLLSLPATVVDPGVESRSSSGLSPLRNLAGVQQLVRRKLLSLSCSQMDLEAGTRNTKPPLASHTISQLPLCPPLSSHLSWPLSWGDPQTVSLSSRAPVHIAGPLPGSQFLNSFFFFFRPCCCP